ncbi:MAG: hypothetical protein ABID04_04285 [Patescibacteria group bacterium]
MFNVYAADPIELAPTGEWVNLSKLTVSSLVSGLIRLALVGIALTFFMYLIWGGFRWIISRGDKTEVENARNHITHALIGLAVVFVAWAILKLIDALFGIDILSLEIPSLF